MFYKPRWKARVAVTIPLVVFITFVSIACYVWNSVKTPVNDFMDWAKPQLEQLETDENFDGDRFGDILEMELNNMMNGKSEDDWKALFEVSTGSNFIEKGAYMVVSMAKEWFENALEKYNSGELPEIDEKNGNNDVENDVEDESETVDQEEVTVAQPKSSNNGTFSQSERNDIEQILDILE